MHLWIRAFAFTTSIIGATAAWAARDFTPQAGTWVVSSEVDGKPGRGLAIDVQGNTFFMQVFGYEKNGNATFYTATGTLDGTTVTAPLIRYKNGRSFGSEARDAEQDSSSGDVTVSFSNGLQGTVQFPGEAPAAIERFLVKDFTPSVSNPLAQIGNRGMHLLVLDDALQVMQYFSAMLTRNAEGQTEIALTSPPDSAAQTLPCAVDFDLAQFQCNAANAVSGGVKSLRLRLAAGQVSGVITLSNTPAHPLPVMGQIRSAYDMNTVANGVRAWVQQNYWELTAPGATITGIPRAYFHQLMPVNGTWIVTDELTGKPGRGLALDVQNSTMVLQVFNYDADGQPTFHMGSGTYASAGVNTLASRADLSLDRYAGGRSLGGPPQPAHWQDNAGVVTVELSLKETTPARHFSQRGTVTFPGEAPRAIQRLQLDAPPALADRLFGEWYDPIQATHIVFNQEENGLVKSADGSLACEYGSTERPTWVRCKHADGRIIVFPLPLLNQGSTWIQIRDRFGNLQGLGKLDQ